VVVVKSHFEEDEGYARRANSSARTATPIVKKEEESTEDDLDINVEGACESHLFGFEEGDLEDIDWRSKFDIERTVGLEEVVQLLEQTKREYNLLVDENTVHGLDGSYVVGGNLSPIKYIILNH